MFNPKTTRNVFFFVPNLIGYSRIVFGALALFFLPSKTCVAVVLYAVSCLLDAFDGTAARRYGQSTSFGAVLDMVTDRSTTSCLLVYLTLLYPDLTLLWQFLIALDLSSHYLQMYSSLFLKGNSHKSVDPKKSAWVLRQYYTNNRVLFSVCAGNELFFIGLYLLGNYFALRPSLLKPCGPVDGITVAFFERFGLSNPLFRKISLAAAPHSIIDAAVSNTNWHIFCHVFKYIIKFDFSTLCLYLHKNKTDIQLLSIVILILITFPIFLFKQVINVIQMGGACRNLAAHDAEVKFGTVSSSSSRSKSVVREVTSSNRSRSKSVAAVSDDDVEEEEEIPKSKAVKKNVTASTPRRGRPRSVSRTPAKKK